jgi:hypothetical protein
VYGVRREPGSVIGAERSPGRRGRPWRRSGAARRREEREECRGPSREMPGATLRPSPAALVPVQRRPLFRTRPRPPRSPPVDMRVGALPAPHPPSSAAPDLVTHSSTTQVCLFVAACWSARRLWVGVGPSGASWTHHGCTGTPGSPFTPNLRMHAWSPVCSSRVHGMSNGAPGSFAARVGTAEPRRALTPPSPNQSLLGDPARCTEATEGQTSGAT